MVINVCEPVPFEKMGAVQRPDVGGLQVDDQSLNIAGSFFVGIFLWLKIWSSPRVSDVYSVESIPNGVTGPGFDGVECS